MTDVSCRAFGPAIAAIEHRGIPFSVLTDRLDVSERELRSTRNRVSWEVHVEITSRLEQIFGGLHALEDLYYEHYRSFRYGFVPKVYRFLFSPRDVYWAGTVWFGPSLFPLMDSCFEELGETRFRETLTIPDRYTDCPQMFALMRGALRAAPLMVGMPAAEVEMDLEPRKAVFTIAVEPARRRVGSIVREFLTHRSGVVMVETMAAQQAHLRENYERLGTAHDRIAGQSERLNEVNAALILKNEELELRVLERTRCLEDANCVLAAEIERREGAAAELLDSREQLRIAERLASVGTLAAGIAHEINNPIAAILLAAQYATSSNEEDDVIDIQRRSLGDIEREARRCGDIVRSVLQFARDEPSAKWSTNLNDVATRAILHSRALVLETDAQVKTNICDETLYCVMNPLQIGQVLVCLLRNAIESKAEGAEVTLTVERRGSKARVTIDDDGAGILDVDRTRIFDPFYTTRRWNGQMGLGLSVAHGIMSEHNETIEIESKVGLGTQACFEIAICEPDDPRDLQEPQQ